MSPGQWTGANEPASRLMRCVESIRDLAAQFGLLAEMPAAARTKRQIKIVVVPPHSLADQTVKLLNTILHDRSINPRPTPDQRRWLQQCLKLIDDSGLAKNGELTTIRDKIAAHVDEEAIQNPDKFWSKIDLMKFVDWTKELIQIIETITKFEIFAWSQLDPDQQVWKLMSVDGWVVTLAMTDGEPKEITAVTLAESPKIDVCRQLKALQTTCHQFDIKARLHDAIECVFPSRDKTTLQVKDD
jgi:hypothetical protein